MTECRRDICTADSDGGPYCSDRCERMATHRPTVDPHTEAYNRARVINNDRGEQ